MKKPSDTPDCRNLPATSLPWSLKHGNHVIAGEYGFDVAIAALTDSTPSGGKADANASYIAHVANAYPKLIAALRLVKDCTFTDAEGPELRNQNAQNHRRAAELLRELGEAE